MTFQHQPSQSGDLDFYTVAETAAILRVTLRTVFAWIQGELLPAVRLGQKLLRIRRRDLEAFIERGQVVPAPPEEAQGQDEQDHE